MNNNKIFKNDIAAEKMWSNLELDERKGSIPYSSFDISDNKEDIRRNISKLCWRNDVNNDRDCFSGLNDPITYNCLNHKPYWTGNVKLNNNNTFIEDHNYCFNANTILQIDKLTNPMTTKALDKKNMFTLLFRWSRNIREHDRRNMVFQPLFDFITRQPCEDIRKLYDVTQSPNLHALISKQSLQKYGKYMRHRRQNCFEDYDDIDFKKQTSPPLDMSKIKQYGLVDEFRMRTDPYNYDYT